MKVYTKTGDDGTTALFGGKRILKSDPLVHAYGTIDELSSSIGFLISALTSQKDRDFLTTIQKNLYNSMAYLSGAPETAINRLSQQTKELERAIDEYEKTLVPLHRFILPQGSEEASRAHMARAVCRRAERMLVSLHRRELSNIIAYINRLSDMLFTIARVYTPMDHAMYAK